MIDFFKVFCRPVNSASTFRLSYNTSCVWTDVVSAIASTGKDLWCSDVRAHFHRPGTPVFLLQNPENVHVHAVQVRTSFVGACDFFFFFFYFKKTVVLMLKWRSLRKQLHLLGSLCVFPCQDDANGNSCGLAVVDSET